MQNNLISKRVLEIFQEITTIPRESGNEVAMTRFLEKFAKDHGLKSKTDKIGNVVITKEASPGKENVPTLVLQGHQDMVCEKISSSNHDFLNDPIEYVIENGWMIANETTLGADDGIGVAACLALLESDLPMGRLECLFTISEETGMDGAMALEPGFFTGKTLINLDSEDEGQLFVGCAGGVNTVATFTYSPEAIPEGYKGILLRIYGAQGGHSGDDINKDRCNTVQQLARFLYAKEGEWILVSFNGGGKFNAIARESEALVAVPADKADDFAARFSFFGHTLASEYHKTDPDVKAEALDKPLPANAVDGKTAKALIMSLVSVHHGVLTMSQDIEGLVETSSNLASVKMKEGNTIVVCTMQRSSVNTAMLFIADRVGAAFRLAGAEVVKTDPYPGWNPNMDSHILKVCYESYVRLFRYQPEVKAIHAGLECGLFLEKFPDLDMISFGPTLRGVHAPGERLDLDSNDKFIRHLVDVVTNFS